MGYRQMCSDSIKPCCRHFSKPFGSAHHYTVVSHRTDKLVSKKRDEHLLSDEEERCRNEEAGKPPDERIPSTDPELAEHCVGE